MSARHEVLQTINIWWTYWISAGLVLALYPARKKNMLDIAIDPPLIVTLQDPGKLCPKVLQVL